MIYLNIEIFKYITCMIYTNLKTYNYPQTVPNQLPSFSFCNCKTEHFSQKLLIIKPKQNLHIIEYK
jgi:hypothetical protein